MRSTVNISVIGATIGLLAGLSGCSGEEGAEAASSVMLESQAGDGTLKARVIDASGNVLGKVRFEDDGDVVRVSAEVGGLSPGFHGMHLHANDNPANGEGCVPPAFTSADAHLNPEGNVHADHAGDMPPLMVLDDGSARLRFETDRVTLAELVGRAVIIHALPDNFHNIPVGPNPDQYTPNSPAATVLTDATGNAGARVACGVIE